MCHYTPESKADSMMWKHPFSPTVRTFKRVASAGKVLATVFWDMHGILLVKFQKPGETVNSAAYQNTLISLKEPIRRRRPGLLSEGVLPLHDNAWPHTANATVDLLKSWKWEILPHPPYSTDLAPSDFHLFPQLKKSLRGNHFQSSEDVKDAVHQWVRQQSPNFYYRGLDSLILRYDKCLNRLSDYVEK